MSRLVNDLISKGYLKTDLIIEAFSEIDRVEFVPENFQHDAGADIPLPIGHGQTISQPLTVAVMMELLDPQRGHKILDVGSGSGWTTALLCYIAGKKGHVTAVERIAELCEKGKSNVEKYGFITRDNIAEFHHEDGTQGYAPNAPYDRILVSASADEIPGALKEQLAVGGKMVIPVYNSLWYVEKKSDTEFYTEEYPGFSFVPLVSRSIT